jgi:hypothetical protein
MAGQDIQVLARDTVFHAVARIHVHSPRRADSSTHF